MSSQVFLAPVVNRQHFINGVPAVGYKIRAYQPNTAFGTPLYSGVEDQVLTQPILLDAWGFPSLPIFLAPGISCDLALQDPSDVTVKLWEDVSPGGDGTATTPTEWGGGSVTIVPLQQISSTVIDVIYDGDIRNTAIIGRRVRTTGAVNSYGYLKNMEANDVQTIMTIELDGAISGGNFAAITGMDLSLLSPVSNAVPARRLNGRTTVLAGDMTVDFKQSVNIWSAGMMVRMLGVNPVPTTIGYRAANGVALSRTAVDVLFGAIGTTFGVGDGSTTYNPPNRAAENNLNWFIYAQD
jgi:hypothetical protein